MSVVCNYPNRILMTADTVGGVWTYALELASALGAAGIEIGLATMGAKMSADQRQELAGLPNIAVFESSYKLEWMNDPWLDVSAAGDWLLDLEERFRPELVHLNNYCHGSLPWRAPKVVVGHSCVLSWWKAVRCHSAPSDWDRYQKAVAAGLRAADRVIAPSESMLAALDRYYGPLARAQVIPNGCDSPGLQPWPKQQFIFSAGRVWDQAKNISSLTKIAEQLPWPVYVAGADQEPSRCKAVDLSTNSGQTVSTAQIANRGGVFYLGRLPRRAMSGWFARASIYALPARYEPFGLSILEAALARCALVLGDIPSLREMWENAALFVSPDDPEEMQAAITSLIEHPANLAEFAARAQFVAQGYSRARMGQNYLDLYADLIRPNDHRASPELNIENKEFGSCLKLCPSPT